MTVSSQPPRKRRARLGITALAVSLLPPAAVVTLALAFGSGGSEVPAWLVVASFIVLPLIEIAVVVLAISALVASNLIGRVLGAIALALVVVHVMAGIDLLNELAAL